MIISSESNSIRKTIAEKLNSVNFTTAIHPSAVISPKSFVGVGSVVMQGAIIQSSAAVGRYCIINTAASVDHDCVVEDFVHISPPMQLYAEMYLLERGAGR